MPGKTASSTVQLMVATATTNRSATHSNVRISMHIFATCGRLWRATRVEVHMGVDTRESILCSSDGTTT
eukprot:4211841-Pleurochrysis_carterae.AAC.1